MGKANVVVDLRKRALEGSQAIETDLRPEVVSDDKPTPPPFSRRVVAGLVAAGIVLGLLAYQALQSQAGSSSSSGPMVIQTIAVESKRFEASLRAGGTLGATNFAVIRAPRMRGARDRGGGGGGAGGGGSSLTLESLAEPGSMVKAGDVVAVFESKRTADMLDNFNSTMAQTRSRTASRISALLSAAATLDQNHRKALADADKSKLELRTAEVRSKIQAEILALQAEQDEASAKQLTDEVRLSRIADAAEKRSFEIDIEKDERRLARTMQDMEKMRLRTPVSGLVVVETMFQRDGFSQASAGDTVNPGSTFLRIVDLSNMAVYADINQADAQLVEIGSPATIKLDAYPEASFEGRVSAIGAVAAAGQSTGGSGRGGRGGSRGGSSGQWVRQVSIQVEVLSQDERIKPDLSASADILLAAEERSLVVPRSALGEIEGKDVVWVQDGEKFAAREVQVGQLSDTEATIRAGLKAGELVAMQPVRDRGMLNEPQLASIAR